MRNTQLFAAFAVLVLASVAAAADPIEGTWQITVTPDESGKAYEDTLKFTPTTMTSEALKKQGFAGCEYESVARAGTVNVSATMKSDKGGQAKWTGNAAGGQITGTLTVTKDGNAVSYSFKGERVRK